MANEQKVAEDLFYLSEDSIYQMLDKLKDGQAVDKTLVYCFVKAFYMQVTTMYIQKKQLKVNIDLVYQNYKETLKGYYDTNNPNMDTILLDQVLNFFDNSFGLIGSVEISDIEDSYEFRHYTIRVFELLHMILEKKSKMAVRDNLFDGEIRNIIGQTEKIWDTIVNEISK